MKCFLVFNQALTKNISKISWIPPLAVPVKLNKDIVDHKKFKLMTTINHSYNLSRRHYTSFIKSTSSWFHCNDAADIPSKVTAVNNNNSFIFF